MAPGEKPTTGPEVNGSCTIKYRTRDGSVDYQFRIVRYSESKYRIYILSQPGYDGRPEDAHSSHRLVDELQRRFVCWDIDITTYEDAKKIAGMWVEATEEYRKTGKRF